MVAESAVRQYVRRARERLGINNVEVMVPQSHPRGALAEVDWGDAGFFLDGQLLSGSANPHHSRANQCARHTMSSNIS